MEVEIISEQNIESENVIVNGPRVTYERLGVIHEDLEKRIVKEFELNYIKMNSEDFINYLYNEVKSAIEAMGSFLFCEDQFYFNYKRLEYLISAAKKLDKHTKEHEAWSKIIAFEDNIKNNKNGCK